MTISVLPTSDFPPDATVAEMRTHLLAMWPGVHATYDRSPSVFCGGPNYRAAFSRFEMLKAELEAADTEPCPVSWCDSSGAHRWSYQLHYPAPDQVARHDRNHRHKVSSSVSVEVVEFDPSCYTLPGEVDPGDDEPVVAVEEIDLHNQDEVEAHIAALREAARIAFGEPAR